MPGDVRVVAFPERWIDVVDRDRRGMPDSNEPPTLTVYPTEDGSFRIEGVPVGAIYGIAVASDSQETLQRLAESTGPRRKGFVVGRVHVAAGEPSETRFEIRPLAPGRLVLSLQIDGKSRRDVRAILTSRAPWEFRHPRRRSSASEDDGVVELSEVHAGSHAVQLEWPGRARAYALDEPVEVPSAGTATVSRNLVRAAGAVRIVDASGAPVSDESVVFQRMLGTFVDGPVVLRSTDEAGVARVRLPMGHYAVVRYRGPLFGGFITSDRAVDPLVTWTTDGPVPNHVRLPAETQALR